MRKDNLYELIKKADGGDAEAQYNAAYHILYDMELGENDAEIIGRAISFLRNSAMSGYCQGLAALELGDLYYHGKRIAKDYKQAVMWYRTAAQKRHPIAYYRLGNCYCYGYGVIEDYAKAFVYFNKGAEGYINNFIRLADMYWNGQYVPQDKNFALTLYRYVYDEEIKFYEKHEMFSNAHGEVLKRLKSKDKEPHDGQELSKNEIFSRLSADVSTDEIL